jgi:uncharacterized protein
MDVDVLAEVPGPLPATDDRDTAGFWEAARRHRLAVLMCDDCDAVLHMPMAYCHHCGSWATRWQETSGDGVVYSWTTVDHQVHPAFPTPYTVVLVELVDHPGVRFVSNLDGVPDLRAGQPMHVVFDDAGDGVVLPRWELA